MRRGGLWTGLRETERAGAASARGALGGGRDGGGGGGGGGAGDEGRFACETCGRTFTRKSDSRSTCAYTGPTPRSPSSPARSADALTPRSASPNVCPYFFKRRKLTEGLGGGNHDNDDGDGTTSRRAT